MYLLLLSCFLVVTRRMIPELFSSSCKSVGSWICSFAYIGTMSQGGYFSATAMIAVSVPDPFLALVFNYIYAGHVSAVHSQHFECSKTMPCLW